jgi:hypothetical protein
MPNITELQRRISFVSAWTQLEIEHNVEIKQLQAKRQTQESREHLYFSEGGQASFPA